MFSMFAVLKATKRTTQNKQHKKRNTMKTIQQQFDEITLMRLFEIQVIDRRTNKIEYIIFNIEINDNLLEATHEGLTQEQCDSNKIAFVSVDIDEDLSLDKHLHDLYSECINAIISSDFFELTEN